MNGGWKPINSVKFVTIRRLLSGNNVREALEFKALKNVSQTNQFQISLTLPKGKC